MNNIIGKELDSETEAIIIIHTGLHLTVNVEDPPTKNCKAHMKVAQGLDYIDRKKKWMDLFSRTSKFNSVRTTTKEYFQCFRFLLVF